MIKISIHDLFQNSVSLFIFLLFGFALSAQHSYKGRLIDTAYVEIIPYRFVEGKILIPVQIEEHTYWFILDTGGELIVSPRIREAHQLKKSGHARVRGVNNTRQKLPKVQFPDIRIGNLTFSKYEGIVSDFFDRYPASCIGADGIIGRDFLKNTCIQFDHPNRRIVLTDQPDKLALEGHTVSTITFSSSGSPQIPVSVNKQAPEMVLFDSGSDDLFSFQCAVAEQFPAHKWVWKGSTSYGINMQPAKYERQYMVELDSVNIAGAVFRQCRTDVSKESRSRVGTRILHYGLVTIDFIQQRYYFKAFPDSVFAQDVRSFGLALEIRDQGYTVRAVLDGSEADQAGIVPGMVIRSVDGYTPGNDREEHCVQYRNGHPWKDKEAIEVIFLDQKGKEQKTILNLIWRE